MRNDEIRGRNGTSSATLVTSSPEWDLFMMCLLQDTFAGQERFWIEHNLEQRFIY